MDLNYVMLLKEDKKCLNYYTFWIVETATTHGHWHKCHSKFLKWPVVDGGMLSGRCKDGPKY